MPLVECGRVPEGGRSGADLLLEHGPTLHVDIGFDTDYDHADGGSPETRERDLPALIYTGATLSCIDDHLAQRLRLPLVDEEDVSGVGGSHKMNVDLAQVFSPQFGYTQYGRFHGVHLLAGGQNHAVLLGRSFLAGFIMIYDGLRGQVTLAR